MSIEYPLSHIAVAGNIGAGKTTLTKLLAKHYGWMPHYENEAGNPYISDFYRDMKHWSFHMQVYYLNDRFKQILSFRKNHIPVIQDRTIYEDAFIFSANLREMGLMTERDYACYQSLFETINELIQAPDLLIYLRASIATLVDQIQKRGREYEDSIRLDYLKKLNAKYEAWISGYKGRLLIVNCDETNFADDPEQLGEVINQIESVRSSLF
ncbi:MAG: deoxynucleoside kinase [Bacteroidetes bacterium]|jgi:deoxyadenosine/deoxycytidine kinase|nr:deoxynucleoside kinase [Bacteroidota bacterium]